MSKTEMRHPDQDQLMDLAYGELSAAETATVQSHVDGCAECAGVLQSIGGVRRAMAPLAEVEAPDTGLESLLAYAAQTASRNAKASEEAQAPVRAWWRRIGFAGTAAAVSAACVMLLIVGPELRRLFGASSQSLSGQTAVAEMREIEPFEQPGRASRPEQERGINPWPDADGVPPPPPAPPPPTGDAFAAATPSRKRKSEQPSAVVPAPEEKAQPKGGAVKRAEALTLGEAIAEEAELEAPAAAPAEAGSPMVAERPSMSMGGATAGSGGLRPRDEGGWGGDVPASAPLAQRVPAPAAKVAMRAPTASAPTDETARRSRAASAPAPEAPQASASESRAEMADDAATTGSQALPRASLLTEAQALRTALASGLTGSARAERLGRLCRVEDALGEHARADRTCTALLQEFPKAPDAAFARERQQRRSAGD